MQTGTPWDKGSTNSHYFPVTGLMWRHKFNTHHWKRYGQQHTHSLRLSWMSSHFGLLQIRRQHILSILLLVRIKTADFRSFIKPWKVFKEIKLSVLRPLCLSDVSRHNFKGGGFSTFFFFMCVCVFVCVYVCERDPWVIPLRVAASLKFQVIFCLQLILVHISHFNLSGRQVGFCHSWKQKCDSYYSSSLTCVYFSMWLRTNTAELHTMLWCETSSADSCAINDKLT